MAHQIVMTYSPVKSVDRPLPAQICATFQPTNAAADLEPFDGTYYDTNVPGWGTGTPLELFMAQQVAYPKLNAYLRNAIREGTYTIQTDDEDFFLYLKECAPALIDQGFKLEFA